MTKYIAVGSVGHFIPGDEIKGLNAERIQALLDCGAIKEATPIAEIDDGPDPKLAQLEKEVADLKSEKEVISSDKLKLEKEVADLKKKLADAEKKLAASKPIAEK